MKIKTSVFLVWMAALLIVGGCKSQPPTTSPQEQSMATTPQVSEEFSLLTGMVDGMMVYLGVGGAIDGAVNPDLVVTEGAAVKIILVNGDGMPHDLAIPRLGIQSALLTSKTQTASMQFTPDQSGNYAYFCTVAGHRQAGMEGKLIVINP